MFHVKDHPADVPDFFEAEWREGGAVVHALCCCAGRPGKDWADLDPEATETAFPPMWAEGGYASPILAAGVRQLPGVQLPRK